MDTACCASVFLRPPEETSLREISLRETSLRETSLPCCPHSTTCRLTCLSHADNDDSTDSNPAVFT